MDNLTFIAMYTFSVVILVSTAVGIRSTDQSIEVQHTLNYASHVHNLQSISLIIEMFTYVLLVAFLYLLTTAAVHAWHRLAANRLGTYPYTHIHLLSDLFNGQ